MPDRTPSPPAIPPQKPDKRGRVIIIKPDFRLRDLIRVPLRSLFTESRIRASQLVLDGGRDELQKRCLGDLNKLKMLAHEINTSPTPEISLQQMRILALRIKGTAGMVGFPLATDMADSLFRFISRLHHISPAANHLIHSHISAINAIFMERRAGTHDPLGRKVLRELDEAVTIYLKQIGSRNG